MTVIGLGGLAVVTTMKCGRGCQAELTGRGGALSSGGKNDAVNTGKRRHLTGEKETSANAMTVGPWQEGVAALERAPTLPTHAPCQPCFSERFNTFCLLLNITQSLLFILLLFFAKPLSLLLFSLSICHVDVNECEDDPCDGKGRCVNSYGSYTCHCHVGYSLVITQNRKFCQGEVILQNHGNETYAFLMAPRSVGAIR